ncbi:MAG: putative quorum-sensing-regulated virulence factor [Acidobacteriota bacterium]
MGKRKSSTLMPFGRYKGRPLSKLPEPYFRWLLTIDLRPPLVDAVWKEAERRNQKALTCDSPGIPPDLAPALTEMVTRGFRAAAREHHPDVGGDSELMRVFNAAREWWEKHVPTGRDSGRTDQDDAS